MYIQKKMYSLLQHQNIELFLFRKVEIKLKVVTIENNLLLKNHALAAPRFLIYLVLFLKLQIQLFQIGFYQNVVFL